MKKGDILNLKIEDVTFGSEGLARSSGKVVFVPGTLPGEEVEARIVKKKRDYIQAKVISFQKKSVNRQEAPCEHYPVCGGCKWQDVNYSFQLELKHRIVSETLRRIGGFENIPILPPLSAPEIFGYRNKMEFSFSAHRWILPEEPEPTIKSKDFTLGLHVPGRYDKVLDIDKCWLQSDFGNTILQSVKEFAQSSKKPCWHSYNHEGFWRYLVIREGKSTRQKMVNIVTFDHDVHLMNDLADHLLHVVPDLKSLVNNVTQSKGGSAFGEKEYILSGSSIIEEKIGDFIFEISANSFFQTNTKQAENLYKKTLEFAELSSKEIVFDLYSGTGTISIFLSQFAKKVIGIEVIESAVINAKQNAKRNKIENCDFILADIREEFRDVQSLIEKYGKPNVLIIDPPRAGIHPKSLKGILTLNPERIVYVSCNPSTFARDVKILCEDKYDLIQVQSVDMFPHTYHVELVGQIKKGNMSI